jgi:very-short-patch-repair endonuclease
LEGCPQGGVVNSSQAKAVNSPQSKVVINNIPLKLNPIIDLPYNPILKKRAKKLRHAENLSEVLFWMQVTKGRFHKIDFDRQRVIGNYIVDFYVKKLGLVIEIDGFSHEGKEEYDKERGDYLISLGLRVYRIQVVDVMQHLSMVMSALEDYIIAEYGE